jgi:predicted nucleic acid-binding protein
MSIDYKNYKISKFSIIDTCSILNIFSADDFYNAVAEAKFTFSYTDFVEYEALYKLCKDVDADFLNRQRNRLRTGDKKHIFRKETLTIEDLQDVNILKARRNLGKGELSSIAFARKANIPFTTDDIAARNLGEEILGSNRVFTTPRILGWLYYNRFLTDSCQNNIISQHKQNKRPLSVIYNEVYMEVLRQLLYS